VQTVSAAFTTAETTDIAQVAAKVYLYRGNYASAAFGSTATASDYYSGDYPPSGVIDGDRTELNIGNAGGADNGVGQSSWRSLQWPINVYPAWVQIYFGQTRKFNYVKVYNLSSNPLTTYTLQWSNDGFSWTTFAGSAYSGYTGTLDIYDFSGVGTVFTAKYIRLYATASSNSYADVVEIEVYYKYDITSRCTSIKTNRQRDWKQINPMASSVELTFSNSDQFFSPYYSPTLHQLLLGYFNSELDTGLKIQVQMGFWQAGTPYYALGYGLGGYGTGPYGGSGTATNSAPELVNVFVGTIDSIVLNSKNGLCQISARDGMKDVINQTWSSKLQYNFDIGSCVQYMLNICNISNYEMNINSTGLIETYFFSYESSAYTVIQQLVQAAGQAQFWFDENGIAQFENLLASSGSSYTDFVYNPVSLSGFSAIINEGSYSNTGATVTCTSTEVETAGQNYTIASQVSTEMSAWQFTVNTNYHASTGWYSGVIFAAQAAGGPYLPPAGYAIVLADNSGSPAIYFTHNTSNPTSSPIGDAAFSFSGVNITFNIFRVVISGSPTWYIYANNVLIIGPVVDSTYTTSAYTSVFSYGTNVYPISIAYSASSVINPNLSLSASGGNLYFTSQAISQTSISSEGNLSAGFSPTTAPITYQTQTANNSSMTGASGFASVTLNSTTLTGPIPSATNTYIQYRFYFAIGSSTPLWTPYYTSVNWNLSVAPNAIRSLTYNSSVCDVTQQLSDSLGGDSSILNYIEVISSPLVLSGTTSTVQWTATTGNPPQNVSVSNPLTVPVGTTVIQAVIPSGMDTSYMYLSITGTAGNSYGAAGSTAFLVTFGTAAGTILITYIHPTKPIISITATTAGTITNLQLIGQSFSSGANPIDIVTQSASSQAKYKKRTTQISNNFITNIAVAQLVANNQLILYEAPAALITGMEILLTPSMQLTDQIQVTDPFLGISSAQTWDVSGISHEITSNGDSATIKTSVTAIIP